MKYILQTERLQLRQFTILDANFIIELLNSPGWIEYIGDRDVKTTEQAKNYLQKGPLKSYDTNGFGLSMVELKEEKVPVGMCGLVKREHLDHPDIGFAFLPEFMGKGLAFEMAKATMKHARDILKLPLVYAITVPENKRSIRLIEKLEMKFIKPFSFPGENEKLLLYSNQRNGIKKPELNHPGAV